MTRRISALCLLLLTGPFLLQCAALPSSTATPNPPSALCPYLLVDAIGEIGHKRPGWQEYLPLAFGATLEWADLLRTGKNAHGLVVCSNHTNLTVAELPGDYLGGLPCSRTKRVLTRGDSLVVGPQRSTPAGLSFPYIIRPRYTFLQTANPLIRWHPSSTGTITYTVRVLGGSVDWQTETTATELIYPDNAPSLEPGVPYIIKVVDSEGSSSAQEKTALDLGFVLLSATEVDAMKALVSQVSELGLSDQATRFVEAEIYASRGLRADAIVLFEELGLSVDAPAIHRRLGDLYLEVGLYVEAISAYRSALNGYRTLRDKYGEAHVLTGIGLAFRGDRNENEAQEYFRQALSLYEAFSDLENAENVRSLLNETK